MNLFNLPTVAYSGEIDKQKQAAEALSSLRVQPVITKKTEVLTKHITEEAKKDPTAMAYIVRSWLSEAER